MKKISSLGLVLAVVLAISAGPEGGAGHAAETPAPSNKQQKKKGHVQVKKATEKPSLVTVDPVRLEPLSRTVPIIGRLVSVQSGKVSAETNGTVRQLNVAIGDRVEAGELIVRLDDVTERAQIAIQQSQIQEAMAELQVWNAELQLAEQNLKRQDDLKKSGAFSRAKHEDAIQTLAKAKANILRAKANIQTQKATRRLTEIALKKSEIRAPYAGVISEKLTELGAYVRAGDTIVTLVSDTNLEIEADIPSARLDGLVVGKTVSWELADGRAFKAIVRALLPIENPLTRTRPVRFTPLFKTPVRRLADSQTLTINIPLFVNKNILTVHKDAIIERGGNSVVYVVANQIAEARRVYLGESVGPRIEVTSGLSKGDLVIVRGNERLRPGSLVKIRVGS